MNDLKGALQDLREESLSGSQIGVRVAPKRVPPQSPKTGWVLGVGILLVAGVAGWFTMGEKATYPLTPKPAASVPGEVPTEKTSAFPASPSPDGPLTNDQVIQLVKSGVSKTLIISQIRNSKTNFGFSTDELIRLAKEHVPDDVIEVMRNPRTAGVAGVAPGAPITSPGQPPDVPTPPGAVGPPQALHATLKGGQSIPVVAASDVLFSASQDGSRIEFTVADDVKIDGHVVIAKGAPAYGTLLDAEKRKLFGRGGKVILRLESVRAVDGQMVKLRTAPLTVPASKSKVKDVAVSKDTPFAGLVEQDTAVSMGVAAP